MPPIAALEIGTTRTVVLVGELGEDDQVSIVGSGFCPTTGVRKGEIVNIENVRYSVAEAVKRAEKSAEASIHDVFVGVSGAHLGTLKNRGMVPVRGHNRIVSREDIDEAIEVAGHANLPESQELLHTVCRDFSLDDQSGIVEPEGMRGAQLAVDVLIIHGERNRLANAANVARGLSLKVCDTAFSGLCAGLSTLSPEQRRGGVVLLDIGGGTTDYLAYVDNKLEAAGTLGLGGDHLNNDVALAFNIPIKVAEEIKRTEGSACVETGAGPRRISVPGGMVGFPGCSLSRRALQTVLNARVDEIFRCVRSQLDICGILPHIGSGVVLTGGGAYLSLVCDLAQQVFGMPCMIGEPVNLSGLEGQRQPASLASAAGLVLYGFRAYEETSLLAPIKNWFKGMLGR